MMLMMEGDDHKNLINMMLMVRMTTQQWRDQSTIIIAHGWIYDGWFLKGNLNRNSLIEMMTTWSIQQWCDLKLTNHDYHLGMVECIHCMMVGF